jgi:TrmH family RNA methyltransferase
MNEINIYSKNAAFQKFEVLKTNRNKRYRYNEFLVEGVRSLKEAAAKGWRIKSFLYDKNNLSDWARGMIRDIETDVNYCLTASLMYDLSGKNDGSELMAVIEMREDTLEKAELSENPLIVLFDRPSNKGNLGTMIRSCDAFGADMLILTGHAVDLYDPDVVVSSMGSFFSLPAVRVADNKTLYDYIARLKEKYPTFKVIGTTAHRETPVYNVPLTGPLMLMIGNETMGLSAEFKEKCDILCTIPMSEKSYASSFNVSCAASVLMYEIVRQRTFKENN